MDSFPCDRCGAGHLAHALIQLAHDDEQDEHVCASCFNSAVYAALGIPYQHAEFEPEDFADARGQQHTFHFLGLARRDGFVVEATELLDGDARGYHFSVLGSYYDSPWRLHDLVRTRVRRALARRNLDPGPTGPELPIGRDVTGRIDASTAGTRVVIDGAAMSWEDFGALWRACDGMQFRLQVVEETDEA